MALFYSFLAVFIFFVLSLILPLIIVLKWSSRPVWAILIACGLYCVPMIAISLASIFSGYQVQTGIELWSTMAIAILTWLIPGFLVLILTQWRSRKRRDRRVKAAIEDAF